MGFNSLYTLFTLLLNLASVVNAEAPAVLWSFIHRYARDASPELQHQRRPGHAQGVCRPGEGSLGRRGVAQHVVEHPHGVDLALQRRSTDRVLQIARAEVEAELARRWGAEGRLPEPVREAYRKRYYWLLVLVLLALGFALELAQRMLGYRSFEMLDMAANLAGIGVGAVAAVIWLGGWCQRVELQLGARV